MSTRVRCSDLHAEACDFSTSGTSASHLAEEIVAHLNTDHPHLTAGATVAEHHARLTARIEDLLAGGPGTPV